MPARYIPILLAGLLAGLPLLADDTSNIVALLNGPSNIVTLAPGTYTIDQITIPAGKTLVGGTPRPTLVHGSANFPVISLSNDSGLEHLELAGSTWTATNPAGGNGIEAVNTTNNTLRQVAVHHFNFGLQTDHVGYGLPLPVPTTAGMLIEACDFRDMARGVNIVNSRGITCRDNTVSNILHHGLQYWGYWDVTPEVRYASDLVFTGNFVTNCGTGAGIWGSYGERVLMQSNTVFWCGDMCLDVEWSADALICDNTVGGAYYGGIGVYFAATNIVISNNVVFNDRDAPADGNGWWVRAGIWLNDPNYKQDIRILDNVIVCATDQVRRAIWVASTNVNRILATGSTRIGAPNWWGDTALAETDFSIIDGVLTGLDPTNAAPTLTNTLTETTWRYHEGSSEPLADWFQPGFNAGTWAVGPMPFWYGDATGGTELTTMQGNYLTLYALQTFTVASPPRVASLTLNIDYDDAAAAWLNGIPIWSSTNTPGLLTHTSTATVAHNWSGDDPGFAQPVESITLSPLLLVDGTNTLAIMGLNSGLLSSDFHLAADLLAGFATTADADHDGLPDGWELQYFGTTTAADSTSDVDGDGFPDTSERLADTDPLDPASRLAIGATLPTDSEQLVLQWASRPARSYALRGSASLRTPWTNHTPNIAATPPLNTVTVTTAQANNAFYQIRLQ